MEVEFVRLSLEMSRTPNFFWLSMVLFSLCCSKSPFFKARLMPHHFQEVLLDSYGPYSSLFA